MEARFEQTNTGLATLMSMVGQLLQQRPDIPGAGATAGDEGAKAGVGHRRPDHDSPPKPTKFPRKGSSTEPTSVGEVGSRASGQGQLGSSQAESAGTDGDSPVMNCDALGSDSEGPEQNEDTSMKPTSTGSSTSCPASSTG